MADETPVLTTVLNPNRVRASFNNHIIADSTDVVTLRERDHEPVHYFPRSDVEMGYFSRTEHSTHCPRKGDASYWTILVDGRFSENGAWSYETPIPDAEMIKDRIAFWNGVEVYELDDGMGAAPAQVPPHDPPYSDEMAAEQERRYQESDQTVEATAPKPQP